MNKAGLIFILLMVSVVTWLLWPQQIKPNSPRNTENNVSSIDALKNTNQKSTTTDPNGDSKKATAESSQSVETDESRLKRNVMNDIKSRQYSDDAYVELASLESIIGLCVDDMLGDQLFYSYGNQDQAKQDLAAALVEKCQSVRDDYPTLMSLGYNQNIRSMFKPSSSLGKLLQRQKDPHLTNPERTELSDLIFLNSIKENNSGLMLNAALSHLFGANTNLPVNTILGTNDPAYASQVSALTIMLLSCQYQGGNSCDSTSAYMVLYCSQNALACGLEFPEWYDQITLTGMKKDVEKLMQYYQQLAD